MRYSSNAVVNLFSVILFTFFISSVLTAQVKLNNPGFEDEPSDARTPMGWFNCERGTTPDILPGVYGIYMDSDEGETYMGIITRADGSFESIGQRLSAKLSKEKCYYFQISLAQAEQYVGYEEPLKLRAWISGKKCGKDQMIFESPFINEQEWKNFTIKFTPENNAKYILLEAFHPEKGTKGHILLDNMTYILPCMKV